MLTRAPPGDTNSSVLELAYFLPVPSDVLQMLQAAFSQFGKVMKAIVVADSQNSASKWLVPTASFSPPTSLHTRTINGSPFSCCGRGELHPLWQQTPVC